MLGLCYCAQCREACLKHSIALPYAMARALTHIRAVPRRLQLRLPVHEEQAAQRRDHCSLATDSSGAPATGTVPSSGNFEG